MSDFLSNLFARNYADTPLIRPRVPSLFEPSPIGSFDDQEFSSSAPIPELPTLQKIAAIDSIATLNDRSEEGLSKPAESKRRANSSETLPQTKHAVFPVASSQADGDQPRSTAEVSGNFVETRVSRPTRRQDFSPVEKRSSTSAQVIRVTIGRVEVHAVRSQPPAPKPAKSRAPKLSLEDYLRKRERGVR